MAALFCKKKNPGNVIFQLCTLLSQLNLRSVRKKIRGLNTGCITIVVPGTQPTRLKRGKYHLNSYFETMLLHNDTKVFFFFFFFCTFQSTFLDISHDPHNHPVKLVGSNVLSVILKKQQKNQS